MADLVADDGADGAVVVRGGGFGIEEGWLQDGGGEVEAVVERKVDGVDGLRTHAPLFAVGGLADAAEGVVVVEEAGVPEIGEEIVGCDFVGGVAAPMVGIADADLEGAEFRDGFLLGGGGHPGDVFEAGAEGGDEVGDDGFGLGLGFGREEALGVDLADGVAEGGGDEDVAAEVAWALLGGSGERGAEEGEALVGEGFGGGGGVGLDEVIGEEIFPGVDGLRGDEGGFAGEGGGLPDDEDVLLVEAGGAEERGPVEAGGFGGEVGRVPGIVGFVDVFAVGEGDLLFGDGGFEGEDTGGAGFGIGEAGEAEHGGDVGLVLGANLLHAGGVGEVVVAVGKLDAALEEVGGVVVGVVEAGSDPEAEDIGGVEVGVVEGIDVGAEGEAEGVGEFALGVDGGDLGEVGLEGGEAVGFDGGLVHVGVVEVGDLALVGAGGGVGFGGVLDDAGDLLEAAVGEDVKTPMAARSAGSLVRVM